MYSEGQMIGMANKQCVAGDVVHNPTVGENLELRIRQLESELERLKNSRETLKPLLEMRIRDIRDAVYY